MNKTTILRMGFLLAAIYDGVLGLAFLVAPTELFRWASVTPPNHPGYVQFPAALLLVFAWMFFVIARAPERGAGLIPYGVGLKISYVGVLGWHWIVRGVPYIWKPFVIADLVFLAFFVWAWMMLAKPARRRED